MQPAAQQPRVKQGQMKPSNVSATKSTSGCSYTPQARGPEPLAQYRYYYYYYRYYRTPEVGAQRPSSGTVWHPQLPDRTALFYSCLRYTTSGLYRGVTRVREGWLR